MGNSQSVEEDILHCFSPIQLLSLGTSCAFHWAHGRRKRAIIAGEIVRGGSSKNQQMIIMPNGNTVPFLDYLKVFETEIQTAMDRFKDHSGYGVHLDYTQFDKDHSGALSLNEIKPFVRGLIQESISLL